LLGVATATVVLGGGVSTQATAMKVSLSAVVTVDGTGVAPPGTAITLDLFLDDQTADENSIPGSFLATNPGTAASLLLVPVSGPVQSVSADATAGNWTASGGLVAIGVITLPFQVVLNGVGRSPDQILPDFSGAPRSLRGRRPLSDGNC